MKRIKARRVGILRGLLETALLGAIFVLGLLAVFEQIPDNALFLGMLYIGAGCALWYTLRLRIPAGSLWRRAAFEGFNTAVLGITVVVLVPLVSIPFGLWDTAPVNSSPGFQFLPLIVCAPGFVGLRVLQYGWFWWDKLRQRKMIWGLVHTQLSVVVMVAVLLSIVGSGVITTDANRNFPEETLAATLAHRIVLTILPFLAVSTVALTAILVGILPPAALASYLFSRRITRRLEALARAASDLRQGEYTARVDVSGADEVAQLQEDFNAMAADLESALADIQTERDKVAALLETRRQLTASVSHELRTPLATLRGYLEPVIENREVSSLEDKELTVIWREVQHLERMVNDLFTLSQVEVNQLTLQTQPTDVRSIAQRLVDTYAPLAWQRGRVEVVAQVSEAAPPARVDAGRLEQIITNLLRKAVRYTPPGGIVAVVVSEVSDWVQVEVRDTGEGIHPDDLPLIWERFFRGSNGQRSPEAEEGAGLGLALVKELTETMGGAVDVESVPGEGSIFTVRLPKA
jgi:signal transduction histidine kinase